MLTPILSNVGEILADSEKPWWSEGIRFACQGSGKCCTSHGEFGYVFLTKEDRRRIAQHLGIATSAFTKKYCAQLGQAYHLKEDNRAADCLFLKEKRCSIYSARPTQCRTWPFWPEVMGAKAWAQEVKSFCPGVGRGKIIAYDEIKKNLKDQSRAEKEF